MTKKVFIGYTKKESESKADKVKGVKYTQFFKDLGVWKTTVLKTK